MLEHYVVTFREKHDCNFTEATDHCCLPNSFFVTGAQLRTQKHYAHFSVRHWFTSGLFDITKTFVAFPIFSLTQKLEHNWEHNNDSHISVSDTDTHQACSLSFDISISTSQLSHDSVFTTYMYELIQQYLNPDVTKLSSIVLETNIRDIETHFQPIKRSRELYVGLVLQTKTHWELTSWWCALPHTTTLLASTFNQSHQTDKICHTMKRFLIERHGRLTLGYFCISHKSNIFCISGLQNLLWGSRACLSPDGRFIITR